MTDTPDQRVLRDELLDALYDAVEASDRSRQATWLNYSEWAAQKNYELQAVTRAKEWLADRDLVKHATWGQDLELTPKGQDEVEKRRFGPAESRGMMIAIITEEERRALEPLTLQVRDALEKHRDELDPDDAADLDAQLETIQAQLRSPRPRRPILENAVGVIRFVATEAIKAAIGNAAFSGVLALANPIFGS